MRLLHKVLLFMFYSTPVWCSLNRTKRTSQIYPSPDMDLQLHSPDLDRILPLICKEPHHRMPWFRRRQEQVFAVNEQLIPQPYYPLSNQHQEGILPDGQLSSQPQFPFRGYDPMPNIPSVNQDNVPPIQPNRNDYLSLNQQQYINNFQNDQTFPNQVQRPPINPGIPVNQYSNYRYPNYNPNINNNQQRTDTDNISKINIEVNNDRLKEFAPDIKWSHQRVRNRQAPAINSQIGEILPPNYSDLYYKPTKYGNAQDTGYPTNSIYTRSVPYLGQSNFPTDLFYIPNVAEPVLGNQYVLNNDQTPMYTIDPQILSRLDEYIQNKIEANQKAQSSDSKQTNDASVNTNSNNQTTKA